MDRAVPPDPVRAIRANVARHMTDPALSPDLAVNHEGERREAFLSVRTVTAQARKVAADLDLRLSGSKLRAIVRGFIRTGHTTCDLRTYVLGYADPTGETAVRHVMEGR